MGWMKEVIPHMIILGIMAAFNFGLLGIAGWAVYAIVTKGVCS